MKYYALRQALGCRMGVGGKDTGDLLELSHDCFRSKTRRKKKKEKKKSARQFPSTSPEDKIKVLVGIAY